MKASKTYSNKYSSIEQNYDETWVCFNDVTGLVQGDKLTYAAAFNMMSETAQHYNAIEHGRN